MIFAFIIFLRGPTFQGQGFGNEAYQHNHPSISRPFSMLLNLPNYDKSAQSTHGS